MSAAILALPPPRTLEAGDRFELTAIARPKLRPKGTPTGRVIADAGDCWRVRFDGLTDARIILKAFIRPENRGTRR